MLQPAHRLVPPRVDTLREGSEEVFRPVKTSTVADVYDTRAELLREIDADEDSSIDFKEVIVKGTAITFGPGDKAVAALSKTLTCFANADGGVVVFGVNKGREIVGYDPAVSKQLQILIGAAARDSCEPPLDHLLLFDQMLLPGRSGKEVRVLKLEVRRSEFAVHAPRGKRPYRRVGAQCVEMSMEHQARLMQRRGIMSPFEEHPVFRAPVDALDRTAIREYLERRFEDTDPDVLDVDRLMRNQSLTATDEVGDVHPTVVGLLLFGNRPTDHLDGAYVDVVVYDGEVADADRQRDAKRFGGSVSAQIDAVVGYLSASPHLPTAATKDHEGRRDRESYSLRALQEGVVNAIVHRDYALVGSQVRVFVFSDRIEISSPGRLHNSLTPENLFAGAQPFRRNQLLAGFLRDLVSERTGASFMESRGEGFLMLVRETRRVAGVLPLLEEIGDSVRLTVPSGPAAT